MERTIGIVFANYTSERLKTLITNRAIASIPFGGRYRFVDFAMSNMVNSGIKYLSVVTPYNYRSLIEHIGSGKAWGIGRKSGHLFVLPGSMYGRRQEYSKFLLRDLLKNRAFVERNDSDYVLCSASGVVYNMCYDELLEFHKNNEAPVTLVYKELEAGNEQSGLFLNVDPDNMVKGMNYSDHDDGKLFLECFIIDRKFLMQIMNWYGNLDHMDILDIIANNGDIPTNAFEFKGYARSVRSVEDYMKASMDLLIPEVRTELFEGERTIYTNVQDKAPTLYAPTSEVSNSFISAGSIIKGKVENSIIFRNVTVEEGAVVKNCILMQYSSVGKNAVCENVICDKYVEVGDGRKVFGCGNEPVLIAEVKKF